MTFISLLDSLSLRQSQDPSQLEALGLLDSVQPKKAQFLRAFETMLKENIDFGIAADFDQNISREGKSQALDPCNSYIDPVARQAFQDIRERGKDVVIISSRGARDIARIIDIPGINIIGSLGWETFAAYKDNPTRGVSHIHPLYKPYRTQITSILRDVRKEFLEQELGLTPEETETEPNLRLIMPDDGIIVIQRKGFNSEYPEGINLTWNLNQVSTNARAKYRVALEKFYYAAFAKYSEGLNENDRTKLMELCSIILREGKLSNGITTLDVEVRPIAQGAKAKAMIQLMRESTDQKRLESFQNIPYHPIWIYSGDHIQQDGPPMRAGHTAYVLTQGRRGTIGIWSQPLDEPYRDIRGVDITVNGVAENAALLADMAELIKAYPQSNQNQP
jgi:hypothetical protein